jgi:DDE superfamily endonuclease
LIRYWLTPPVDPQREESIGAICQVYRQAPELVKEGERTISTDELTGVQALERKHPGLPLAPGKVERREFEYTRHGTRAFILSRDVVTGKMVAPHAGPTRAAFLSDPTHKIVFHYTPNHSSWMNQIEIWLSILVRKLLRRGSFTSVQDLGTKVLAFIDYYNRTMAKPFKWTYQGKALTI